MDDRDLQYFYKLMHLNNFTETAQFFHVTQPAISTAIKRLERRYHCKLIYQKNKKSQIKLTEQGRILYIRAQEMINLDQELTEELQACQTAHLKIGFSGVAGNTWLPKMISQFHDPKMLNIIIPKYECSNVLLRDLASKNIDVAIFSWLFPITDTKYQIRLLAKNEFVLIVSPKNPLAKLTAISITDLFNAPFITRESNYLVKKGLSSLGNFAGFTPKVIYQAPTMDLIFNLVKENVGIALVMADSVRESADLKVIHLPKAARICYYMQLAVRKDSLLNQRKQVLLNDLLNVESD